jgi:hypothetical protein
MVLVAEEDSKVMLSVSVQGEAVKLSYGVPYHDNS